MRYSASAVASSRCSPGAAGEYAADSTCKRDPWTAHPVVIMLLPHICALSYGHLPGLKLRMFWLSMVRVACFRIASLDGAMCECHPWPGSRSALSNDLA